MKDCVLLLIFLVSQASSFCSQSTTPSPSLLIHPAKGHECHRTAICNCNTDSNRIKNKGCLLHATANTKDRNSGEEHRSSPEEVIRQCANKQAVDAAIVISALETLEKGIHIASATSRQSSTRIDATSLDGNFELIFSSSVANLPLVGKLFGGYMPNKEIITFDIDRKQMSLIVELFPFLPTIDIYGDSLTYDETAAALEYQIRGKEGKPPSRWDILYADGDIVAARSSVTGLNVIRRV